MALDVYFQEDIAGLIVGILVQKGSPDSHDLRALATLVRVPWAAIQAAYWEQMGVGESVQASMSDNVICET